MDVMSVLQSEQNRNPNMPILLQNQSGTLTKEFGFFSCVKICILPQAFRAVSGPDGAVLLSLSLSSGPLVSDSGFSIGARTHLFLDPLSSHSFLDLPLLWIYVCGGGGKELTVAETANNRNK